MQITGTNFLKISSSWKSSSLKSMSKTLNSKKDQRSTDTSMSENLELGLGQTTEALFISALQPMHKILKLYLELNLLLSVR